MNDGTRLISRSRIYRAICNSRETSRQDLVKTLNISLPTILQNISSLLEEGLVKEVGQFGSTGGRKAVKLAPVLDKKFAIGLEITKHYISAVLINMVGGLLYEDRFYNEFKFGKSYNEKLGQIVNSFYTAAGIAREDILGCGIALPGNIDTNANTLIFSHALGIEKISLESFGQYIGFDCFFINDSNAAGLIELQDMPVQPMAIYLALNDSVDGSIFINGNLYQGNHFRSGGFGHTTLYPGKKECVCGKRGCADVYLSAWVLARETDGIITRFLELRDKNDPYIKKVWSRYLDDLARFISNLYIAFDCTIIVGGYIGGCMEGYLPELQARLAKENIFDSALGNIKLCRIIQKPSAVGAAMQPDEKYIDSI
jgi:predicted NBD/HSP70 family sugar kinase